MDRERFSSDAPGRLERIAAPVVDWAFVPDPLPPAWEFPAKLWPLLAEAKQELARLDGAGRHVGSVDLLLRPLQKREALRSSSLEGTYATPQQLLLYELSPRAPKGPDDPANAWREVWNYQRALVQGQELMGELPVSSRLVRSLHRILLDGVRGRNRTPGEFRKRQVFIGTDRRFVPPPADEMLRCLTAFERAVNEHSPFDPLVDCFLAHYQFETIHPFLDGNGRVGRLLLSLMIAERCGLGQPWLYLSEYFEQHKNDYIDRMFDVSARGDWENWIRFCLEATISQAKAAMNRMDALIALKQEYQQRLEEAGGSLRLSALLDQLFVVPILSIPDARELLGVTYPTAKRDLERLVMVGVVVEDAAAYPKTYSAPDVLRVAYGV